MCVPRVQCGAACLCFGFLQRVECEILSIKYQRAGRSCRKGRGSMEGEDRSRLSRRSTHRHIHTHTQTCNRCSLENVRHIRSEGSTTSRSLRLDLPPLPSLSLSLSDLDLFLRLLLSIFAIGCCFSWKTFKTRTTAR